MKKLEEYNKKRNFNKTKEPIGIKKERKKKKLIFIVQHHEARKDHYDFRLEWNGVLVSFAVPKGPSWNPLDKRLAIKVEDHPLSYSNFEGTIPKGEYGGGSVMLWDKGYWYPDATPNFKDGVIKFNLEGERLKGKWSLVKIKSDKDNSWLLIKEKDKYVSARKITTYKRSIKTNRTMNEIRDNKETFDDIEITHPKKVIIDKGKITKEDIVNYYKRIGKRMMPYLDNRLISTIRCPEGIKKENFFMKHLNTKSKNIGKKKLKNKGGEISDYYYIKNEKGLIEEVCMNSYEFHIWGSLVTNINKPDILVFDFDPDENLSLKKLREGVLDLKKILDKLKIKSYLKTSGGKGYHVFVPLKTNSWSETEDIAKKISEYMTEKYENKYTINMRKEKRENKIFIDYFRNKKGATSVCPYSIRLRDNGPISCPIFWSELSKTKPNSITIKNINERLKKKDPWSTFFK